MRLENNPYLFKILKRFGKKNSGLFGRSVALARFLLAFAPR
jgi:hypothetical protein